MAPVPAPWKHQIETIDFLADRPDANDFSDAGVGKTRAQLGSFVKQRGASRLLVLCPKTLMYSAWGLDIEKFTPDLTYSLAYAECREEAFNYDTNVVITNVDAATWLADKSRAKLLRGFTDCVVDESSAFKHPTAKRSKALVALRKHFKRHRCMTATPNPITVTELWNPMMFVDGGKRLGNSFYHMRNIMQVPRQVGPGINHIRWDDRPGAAQAVDDLIADITIRHDFAKVMSHIPLNERSKRQFELSPKARKLYTTMENDCVVALKDSTVTAVHAAALRTKLLQMSCLAEGTEVLTKTGWKTIEDITPTDFVWDGEEWVNSCGSVNTGYTNVIECDGVYMTNDHKVLTVNGWATAQEVVDGYADGRFNRAAVRPPNGCAPNWKQWPREYPLANEMRLRQASSADWLKSEKPNTFTKTFLWLQSWRCACRKAWFARDDKVAFVQSMVENNFSVSQPARQRLQKLRCAWHSCVQEMARFVRFVCYGCRAYIQAGVAIGPSRQQSRILEGELPLGYSDGAGQQYTRQCTNQDTERTHDRSHGGASVWHKTGDAVSAHTPENRSISPGTEKTHVYDIVNVGTRHRFTVRGHGGKVFIVHNSGAVYNGNEEGSYSLIDPGRYELIADLIDVRKHSLVFFNWKHQRDELAKEFSSRGYSFAVIDGNVPQRERDRIVSDFQAGAYKVILLHPRTGAHGLTLTRATTTIIASPIYEADLLKQAIHRTYRGGQENETETILIEALGTVEAKVYERLFEKEARMTDLLTLIQNRRKT